MRFFLKTAALGFYLLAALLLPGCSSWPRDGSTLPDLSELPDDVSAQRKLRAEEAAQEFEQKRNDIEVAAARSHWQQGDIDGCVELLDSLLSRVPDHAEALALMAEANSMYEAADSSIELSAEQSSQHLAGPINGGSGPVAQALFAAPALAPQGSMSSAPDMPRVESQSDNVRCVDHRVALQPQAPGPPLASPNAGPRARPSHRSHTGYPPGDPAVALRYAEKALAQRDITAAGDHLIRVLQDARTDAVTAVSAAVLPLRHGQPELALYVATAAVHRFGSSAGLFRVIGTAYYRAGDYQSSQAALQQALFLDRSHPLTYLLLSSTLAKLGNREAADWYRQQAHLLEAQRTARR